MIKMQRMCTSRLYTPFLEIHAVFCTMVMKGTASILPVGLYILKVSYKLRTKLAANCKILQCTMESALCGTIFRWHNLIPHEASAHPLYLRGVGFQGNQSKEEATEKHHRVENTGLKYRG